MEDTCCAENVEGGGVQGRGCEALFALPFSVPMKKKYLIDTGIAAMRTFNYNNNSKQRVGIKTFSLNAKR